MSIIKGDEFGFLKEMLELSRTIAEADENLTERTGIIKTSEKIKCLHTMFDIEVYCHKETSSSDEIREYNDYLAMLATIINGKWM